VKGAGSLIAPAYGKLEVLFSPDVTMERLALSTPPMPGGENENKAAIVAADKERPNLLALALQG